MKHTIASVFVPLSVVLTAAAHAQQTYRDHPHMWDGPWGWWGMIFGPFMMIAFVAAVVLVVVLLVRWLSGGAAGTVTPPSTGQTALDILKERFARGEIEKEEFEERKRLLSD